MSRPRPLTSPSHPGGQEERAGEPREIRAARVGETVGVRMRGTILGFAAIVLWSTNVPATRALLERLGTLPGSAISLLLAGTCLLLLTTAQARGLGWARQLSWRHVGLCGPLFVLYFALLNPALGLAGTRSVAIVAGLINYLWPTFVLVFSIPLLGARPRTLSFLGGVAMSLGGVALAASIQFAGLGTPAESLGRSLFPFLLAFAASVVWGVYSNLAKRFPQPVSTGAVGIFLVAAGAALALVSAGRWHDIQWTLAATLELAYVAVFPLALGYALWDIAMRDGNLALVGSASNLIPILSTAISAALLGVPFRSELLGGAALVVLGALLSQAAFRSRRKSLPPDKSRTGAARGPQ